MIDYADFERRPSPIRVPNRLRFPHAFQGHRYIGLGAVPGGGFGGGLGGGGGRGGTPGETPSAGFGGGQAGGAGAAATGGGQGGFGGGPFVIQGQLTTKSPALSIASQRGGGDNALTVSSQRGGGDNALSSQRGGGGADRGGGLVIRGQTGGVPVLDTSKPCTVCNEIRGQIDDVKKSIIVEQKQDIVQKLEQQKEEIQRFQESEQRGDTTNLDQQIAQKLELLTNLENQLTRAQQIAYQESQTSEDRRELTQEIQQGTPQLRDKETLLDKIANLADYYAVEIPTRVIEGLIHEIMPFLSDEHAKTLADSLAKLTPPGVINQLNHWLEGTKQKGMREPQKPVPVEFCITCESSEDALKYQAGEGDAKCFLVEGSVHHAASMH